MFQANPLHPSQPADGKPCKSGTQCFKCVVSGVPARLQSCRNLLFPIVGTATQQKRKNRSIFRSHMERTRLYCKKKKSFENPPREQKKATRKMEMDVEGRRAGKNISRWNTKHLEKSDHCGQKETENLHEIEVFSSSCWFKSLFSSSVRA